jgi:epidermal growth factor receptor substrate 15
MQKPPLKLNLVGREHGHYSNMMSLATVPGENKVGGKEAVVFFKKSGLPVDKLKEFWKIAARTSNEYLTRDEFYIALRLIAYAQNGL